MKTKPIPNTKQPDISEIANNYPNAKTTTQTYQKNMDSKRKTVFFNTEEKYKK